MWKYKAMLFNKGVTEMTETELIAFYITRLDTPEEKLEAVRFFTEDEDKIVD